MDARAADRRADVLLGVAAGLAGAVLVTVRVGADDLALPVRVEAAAQLVGGVIAMWSRRRPLATFGSCVGLSLLVPLAATSVAAFAVGRWRPSTVATAGAVLGGLAALCLGWRVTERGWDPDHVLWFVGATVLGWLVGAAFRDADQDREARAAAAVAQQALLADVVRQGERDQLAREMHDVVAHRVSLMVLDANRIEAGSAPDPRAVAAQIRETGRGALDDMREVLGRLRADELADGLSRQSLQEVDRLAAQVRATGQPVAVRMAAAARLPPDLAERTAVRVVREALTNAARHSPGAPTVVDVRDAHGTLVVEVRNDAPTRPPDPRLTTGGHGLLGMAHRVEVVGGRWQCGPTESGGFVVQAVLPRERR